MYEKFKPQTEKIDNVDIMDKNIASTSECTGLYPRPLCSENELEAYEAIYEHTPRNKRDMDSLKKERQTNE